MPFIDILRVLQENAPAETDPVELQHWRAVAAKPSDEAPRWEYLKYLRLKGSEERARFMQLQLDAAFCRPWDFLALEAANFRGAYFSEWGPLRPATDVMSHPLLGETRNPAYKIVRWEGGFPSELRLNSLLLPQHHLDTWATVAPITRLDLGELTFHPAKYLDDERRVAALELLKQRNIDPSSERAQALVAAKFGGRLDTKPPLEQLTEWTNNALTNVLTVVDRDWFPRIRHLRFGSEHRLLCRLLRELKLDHLHGLSLAAWSTVDNAGPVDRASNAFDALFRLSVMKTLSALSLSGDGAEITSALDALGGLPALEHLTLDADLAGPTLLRLLTAAPGLRRLEMRCSGWGPTLAAWPGLEQLEELVTCTSSAADLRTVMATNKLERMRSLRIDQTGDATAEDFAFIFASLNKLQRLSIRRSRFDDAALDALMSSHAFPQLVALEIDNCQITDDSVFRLAKTIHLPKLKWLRLAPFSRQLTEQSVFTVQQRFQPANKMAFDF